VLSLTPRNLAEIEENIVAIGDATGRAEAARQLVSENRERVRNVVSAVSGATARRVAFLEWTEPLFCAGHWVPEMVSAAGGDDPLGQPGADSQRMTWDDVAASSPEMIIVAPCGYGLKDAIAVANRLPRVIDAEIYAVDANAYFARPGPRVAEGMELLAHLFHPDNFAWPHEHRPWKRVI
jgi:iron complex transport system substrate-binding protein